MKEDKDWIARIIESSKTEFHFQACHVLINLFAEKHISNDMSLFEHLDELRYALRLKEKAQQ